MRDYNSIARSYAKRLEYRLYIRTRYARSARSLKNKLNKSDIVSLTKEQKNAIDALWKGKKFDKRWFDFYNSIVINQWGGIGNDYPIEYYIPNDFYYSKIDPWFNQVTDGRTLDDKNLYDLLFKGVKQPHTMGHIINGVLLDSDYKKMEKEQLLDDCKQTGHVIFKPSIGTVGGKGIAFWNSAKNTVEQLEDIINGYKNAIVQEVVKQSPTLALLHPSSLQTVRIMTMYSAGETKIVSVVLRMGRGNALVDNVSAGGIAVGIDEKGKMRKYAFDVNGNRFEKHPTTNVVFDGIQIPGFDKCCEMVKFLAPRLGRTQRLISWDLSIDSNESPVLIEANLTYGQLDFHQMCNGPLFKDKIVDVLEQIEKK